MSGELVKIGARRGAIVLWQRILKVIVTKKIPGKILEKLVWDLLLDLIKETVSSEKSKPGALVDMVPSVALPDAPSEIVIPNAAEGVRWELNVDNSLVGRILGYGGAPDCYALNEFSNQPCYYAFRSARGYFGLEPLAFARGYVSFERMPDRPTRFVVYPKLGITGTIIFVERK